MLHCSLLSHSSRCYHDYFVIRVNTVADGATSESLFISIAAVTDVYSLLCSPFVTFSSSHQANKDFVSSLGLSHEQSLHKMRLLTLMQLAESRRELPFELLQQELQLQDVEGFVVEALRTRMLTAKIDQMGRKVIVGTTVHRTFGRHQWVQLKESLAQWHDRLGHVESSMDRVTRAHFEPLTAPPTA